MVESYNVSVTRSKDRPPVWPRSSSIYTKGREGEAMEDIISPFTSLQRGHPFTTVVCYGAALWRAHVGHPTTLLKISGQTLSFSLHASSVRTTGEISGAPELGVLPVHRTHIVLSKCSKNSENKLAHLHNINIDCHKISIQNSKHNSKNKNDKFNTE